MACEFFGRQRGCRFYTAGCGNKMAVIVTGPRAVNELGGPVIPGIYCHVLSLFSSLREQFGSFRFAVSIFDIQFFTEETLWRGGKVQWKTFYEGNVLEVFFSSSFFCNYWMTWINHNDMWMLHAHWSCSGALGSTLLTRFLLDMLA